MPEQNSNDPEIRQNLDTGAIVTWARSYISPRFSIEAVNKGLQEQKVENADTINNAVNGRFDLGSENSHWSSELSPLFLSDRQVVVITAHWGNYLLGLMQIASAFPTNSSFITVRGRDWDIDEEKMWENVRSFGGRDISVLKKGEFRPSQLLRGLRTGRHLFVLFDVDRSYGRNYPVDIFGQTFHFGGAWREVAFLFDAVVMFIKPPIRKRMGPEIYSVVDRRFYSSKEQFETKCQHECGKLIEEMLRTDHTRWFGWSSLERFVGNE